MTWVLVVVILVVVGMFALSGAKHVPWAAGLRRLHAGAVRKAEWIAPDEVVERVSADYLLAMRWLRDSVFDLWTQQWAAAPSFLSGAELRRYQKILTSYRSLRTPRYIGVLNAEHRILVRDFSEDGERCLVIDCQRQRRMTTYDYRTQAFRLSQTLEDCALVYQMIFDKQGGRWKIESFVQELPAGFKDLQMSRRVRLLSELPSAVGRDN